MADVRIKDLAAFSGTPTATDFLAIDSANETKKIPSNIFALDSKTKLNVSRLGSGDDLDTLYGNDNSGFYYITNNVANAPTTYASLIVIAGGTPSYQLVWNATGIMYRAYVGNPLAWTEWRSIGQTTRQTITGEYISGQWIIKRNGNVVTVQVGSFSKVITGQFRMNGVIPEGFRPTEDASFTFVSREGTPRVFALQITPAGDMVFYNYNAALASAVPIANVFSYIV